MNLLAHAQDQARRFNEDEAVQRECHRLRDLRRLDALQAAVPEDVTDVLDWHHARASCCQVRAISSPLP